MPPILHTSLGGGGGRNGGDMQPTHAGASFSLLFSPAASSLASTPGGGGGGIAGNNNVVGGGGNATGNDPVVELEVHWEPSLVKSELLQATAMLSHRGLKLAAKWAAEQAQGVVVVVANNNDNNNNYNNYNNDTWMLDGIADLWKQEMNGMTCSDWYAKSLLDLGEYMHAAAILSESTTTTTTMDDDDVAGVPVVVGTIGSPSKGLSSFGIYLRAYALYMAGERRKEEEYLELQSSAQSSVRNPYLTQLVDELDQAYDLHSLDAFGLYVYGLVLKEAQLENLPCPRSALDILVESILQFPLNWSAWLDLGQVLSALDAAAEQKVEQALQPTLTTHYMYHFFCAHLMAHHHQAHEDALVLYDRLYEPIPEQQQPLFASSYIQSQMGVAHYHLREFEQALECFHQIKDPYILEDKDIYSNILFVKEDRVALSQLAHRAVRIDKYRPETCCIIGNYYSIKQQRQKAVQYFQRALKLDRTYTSAWTLMGHEYVELKQTESAMEAYRRAVAVSPKDYRAWYGLGQTYEFLNMHLYALFYYRKAAMLRPYDARMWCAVGLCFVALHKISDAIRAYERAVAQEDTEGIATQALATLYRQESRPEEAAQCYLRHLELRYMVTNPSPASGGGGPNLDAIVQGVVVDGPAAEALIFLAQYYKTNGEYDTAALFCSRLVEYPGPEKEQAKGILRDLRSRGRRFLAPPTPQAEESAADKSSFEFSP